VKPRGRGRAPKVYEPADGTLTMSVPPRQYELVGEILADAVAGDPSDARAAAESHAADVGRKIGAVHRDHPVGDLAGGADDVTGAATDDISAAYATLTDLGFEPRRGTAGDLSLGNCPFHGLAVRHPELVCGLNEALITGVLEGLGADGLCARLQPEPGSCCVRVSAAAAKG
jgi:predicted ArsR family transcriptional regulator